MLRKFKSRPILLDERPRSRLFIEGGAKGRYLGLRGTGAALAIPGAKSRGPDPLRQRQQAGGAVLSDLFYLRVPHGAGDEGRDRADPTPARRGA